MCPVCKVPPQTRSAGRQQAAAVQGAAHGAVPGAGRMPAVPSRAPRAPWSALACCRLSSRGLARASPRQRDLPRVHREYPQETRPPPPPRQTKRVAQTPQRSANPMRRKINGDCPYLSYLSYFSLFCGAASVHLGEITRIITNRKKGVDKTPACGYTSACVRQGETAVRVPLRTRPRREREGYAGNSSPRSAGWGCGVDAWRGGVLLRVGWTAGSVRAVAFPLPVSRSHG